MLRSSPACRSTKVGVALSALVVSLLLGAGCRDTSLEPVVGQFNDAAGLAPHDDKNPGSAAVLTALTVPPRDALFTLTSEPPKRRGCTAGTGCIEHYLSLHERVSFPDPKTEVKEIERALERIKEGKTKRQTRPLKQSALNALIRETTGAEPLLDRVGKHQRVVRVLSEGTYSDHRRLTLLFEDPLVGPWEAILLLPLGAGPHPAFLASHGHAEDGPHFLRYQKGAELPGLGVALLVHNQRASTADKDEDRAARALLAAGSSLMAVRAYEIAVGLAFLRSSEGIDPQRIGLIGHSGGSIANLLTIRMVGGFSAHVTDGIAEYNSWDEGLLADESLPPLFPVSAQISDVRRGPVPGLELEYSYPNGMSQASEFLTESQRQTPSKPTKRAEPLGGARPPK